MQFLEFISLLRKTWIIIYNFRNFFPFSKNVYYHMQLMKFHSLLQKRELSYAIYEISFSSSKTWSIICNLWNLIPFSKNVDYHMQFLELLSLLKEHGLSYAIYGISPLLYKCALSYAINKISFSSPKMWTIICNL